MKSIKKMTRIHRLLIRMRPVLRFLKTRILHIDDTPDRIARGIGIGVFTAWLPVFGLHIPLAFIFAAIARANKVMALLFIWISNPATALFIYYPAYRLGHFILGIFQKEPTVGPEQMETMFERTLTLERFIWEIFTVDLWKQLWATFSQVGTEMLIGGILLGMIAGDISYRLSYALLRRFRIRRRRRRLCR